MSWDLGLYEIGYFGYCRFVALAVVGVAEVLQKLEYACIAEELGDLCFLKSRKSRHSSFCKVFDMRQNRILKIWYNMVFIHWRDNL